MKVAITGGSGQLGTILLRRLAADRSIKQIVAIDVRPPSVPGAKIHAVRADVRDTSIAHHLRGCDAVIHLAFVVTGAPPREVFDAINVGGSKNVFEGAAAAGAKQVLYASSIAAYGVALGHPTPIVEETPRRLVASFAYSATKYQVEEWLDAFEPRHPTLAIARFRPGILVGSRMEHALGDALRARRLVDLDGTRMPIVWDEDVADAFMLALKKGARGAFNLVADEPLTATQLGAEAGLRVSSPPRAIVRAASKIAASLARMGVGREIDPAWLDNLGVELIVSSEKAKRELSWKPKHPTAAAVMRHYVAATPARADLRIKLFLRLAGRAARMAPKLPDSASINVRIHVALTGEGGGDWTFDVSDGRLHIHEGMPRAPSATLTLKASTFLELMAGKMDFGSAQLTGKVRVEGEPRATMVLGGMVQMFNKAASEPGARGLLPRQMARWFGR